MQLLSFFTYDNFTNFILFIIAIIGVIVSVKSLIDSTNQRKIENAYKTLDYLRLHISDEQIKTFINLFHANNELNGGRYNEFIFDNGRTDTIETMFSEGGCGNGDIHNMASLFNLLVPTFKKIEFPLVWYEYGQIMTKIYAWTGYLVDTEDVNLFPDFHDFMKSNLKSLFQYRVKYYTYAE